MTHPGKARTALKRGALLVAANWQVVAIQSVADTTYKMLAAVPILGGALLVTLLLNRDIGDILGGDLRESLFGIAETLMAHPVALAAYLFGFFLVAAGGAVLMFLVKGGTVSVLIRADRLAGPIEQPPLRLVAFRRGMQFSTDGFTRGASGLFRRYLRLGVLLAVVYTLAAALCLVLAYGLYRVAGGSTVIIGSVAALALTLFVALTTVINVLYLLAQIVVAVGDMGVGRAIAEVPRFVRGEPWKVLRVFLVTVLLLVLATALSVAAGWGFYLIAYIPLASIIILPLQLGAWLLRSLLFQYLGLTALGAYLSLYRSFAGDRYIPGPAPASSR
ncbi:MAG TPA: hypothetical protein VK911_02225 [Vicinamibacterales bacterium]|nr:hypothetical protein [Vicinamibacterales bacterium]